MRYTIVIAAASEDTAREHVLKLVPEGPRSISLSPSIQYSMNSTRWIAQVEIDFDEVYVEQATFEGRLNYSMQATRTVWWSRDVRAA